MGNRNTKYTKENLAKAARKSVSVRGVLTELGLAYTGNNHKYIKSRLTQLEVDTSHFLGRRAAKGVPSHQKKPHGDRLVNDPSANRRVGSAILRRSLIESGVPYKCNCCNLPPYWKDAELTLQVDHIDGDWRNNLRGNLQFLCPNCHPQKKKHWSGDSTQARPLKGNRCDKCLIHIAPTSQLCRSCHAKRQGHKPKPTKCPPKDSLSRLLQEFTNKEIGCMFSVSDVTVGKWARKLNLSRG